MEDGKQFLTFPGPGGYKLETSPGSVRIPLQKAMSGHLMAPLVAYSKLKKMTGIVPDDKQVLHANASGQVEKKPEIPSAVGAGGDADTRLGRCDRACPEPPVLVASGDPSNPSD